VSEQAKAKHTEEPWKITAHYTGPAANVLLIGREPTAGIGVTPLDTLEDSNAIALVADVRPESIPNAHRIVHCVNGCAGIANPAAVPELVKAVEDHVDANECGCATLRSALNKAKGPA
jgi:hypothetical protein